MNKTLDLLIRFYDTRPHFDRWDWWVQVILRGLVFFGFIAVMVWQSWQWYKGSKEESNDDPQG